MEKLFEILRELIAILLIAGFLSLTPMPRINVVLAEPPAKVLLVTADTSRRRRRNRMRNHYRSALRMNHFE